MATVKVFMRIARNSGGRTPFKVDASPRPNHRPLTRGSMNDENLPTLAFAVLLNVPDDAFRRAEQVVAEIDVPSELPLIAADVE